MVFMKTWSKVDLIGLFFVLFGIVSLLFSGSSILITTSFVMASLLLMHGVYKARFDAVKYHDIVCHYQALLSTSNDGWIVWNKDNEYVGSSKKLRDLFGIKKTNFIFVSDLIDVLQIDDADNLSFYFNKLKKVGESFQLIATTIADNKKVEIKGSRIIIDEIETILLWCVNVTTSTQIIHSMESQISEQKNDLRCMHELMDAIPVAVWSRNRELNITYCNRVYANYLDTSVEDITYNNIPLIPGNLFGQGHSLAENAKKCRRAQSIAQFVVINGMRKKLSMNEIPIDNDGLIGFAVDVTTEENLSSNLDKVVTANCEVLESLSTSIAIFNESYKLIFFNSSYQRLMKLEANWLHSKPSFSEILDENRNNRQLPEHADYHAFKKAQLALFTSVTAPAQELLHLPNGKTLRQVVAPYPLGGLLFMYEDVTDSLALQRKNNTLLAVQKETIDHLYEGITVYGSDNRLKIVNNSMMKIWKLNNRSISTLKGTHLSEMLDFIKDELDFGSDWGIFRENAISNLTDRIAKTGKLMKKDNSVIMFSYIPLPDGAHMHSFIDVTDTCVVEQAIMEKNQALKASQKLRFEFVSGISTELKEPLSILIGFAELLIHQYFGLLNDKQIEYCQHILDASHQLHMLVDNLLEMVSIDIESVSLNLSEFYIHDAVNEAICNITKRANEKNIDIVKNFDQNDPIFIGDKIRIKQAIFNILINAIQFTPPNGKVDIRIVSSEIDIKIIIYDSSVGAAKNADKKVFRRTTSKHFGLSSDSNSVSMPLVRSLIELHDGNLSIVSDAASGTRVICSLPWRKMPIINENEQIKETNPKKIVNL